MLDLSMIFGNEDFKASYDCFDQSEFKEVPKGGYVGKITKAEHFPEKKYFKIYFDICEGEYKNAFEKYNKTFLVSYKSEKSKEYFKRFRLALYYSNAGFLWSGDEKQLQGKQIGIVLRESEYFNREQELKIGTEVQEVYPTSYIREKRFKVWGIKRVDPCEQMPF